MLPLSVQKVSKDEMEQNYKEVTEALGIYELSDKYPSEISGGQQQRTVYDVHSFINRLLSLPMNRQEHLIRKVRKTYSTV